MGQIQLFASQALTPMPRSGLWKFLSSEAGSQVFVKDYTVSGNGAISFRVIVNGTHLHDLGGLTGCKQVKAVFAQEGAEKVVYIWKDAQDIGKPENLLIKCVVSKRTDSGWQLLQKPQVIFSHSYHHLIVQEAEPTNKALTEGLQDRQYCRWWTVITRQHSHFVGFNLANGEEMNIFGFRGFAKVYCVMREEAGQIIGRFYADEKAAQAGSAPLKTVILSKLIRPGYWLPAVPPQIISVSSEGGTQYERLTMESLKAFLCQTDKAAAEFLIDPRKVSDGRVALHLGREMEPKFQGMIAIPGFRDFSGKHLYGKIVIRENRKVAYFWTTADQRASGKPAIYPEGYVVASRPNLKSSWEIVWRCEDAHRQAIIEAANNFKTQLVDDASTKPFTTSWPTFESAGKKFAQRKVGGMTLRLNLPKNRAVNGSIYSQTHLVAGALKLAYFWTSASEVGIKPALSDRVIAYKTDKGIWEPCWGRLQDRTFLKQLFRDGILTATTIDAVLTDSSMQRFAEETAWKTATLLSL